ncbi:hypothetical protein H0E87_000673 [Populus deltoides]|uniref:Uncharacterized protein n=1 Tax=Populus deltoides TaxID=3696 RepID=A0A8T2ZNE2_POPDE|nr:hypothetical protein H0E87_000673 [Populus deltoides]
MSKRKKGWRDQHELDGPKDAIAAESLHVLETFTACTIGVTPSSCVAIENPSASTDGVSNSSGFRVQHIDPIAGAKDCSGASQSSVLGNWRDLFTSNVALIIGLRF